MRVATVPKAAARVKLAIARVEVAVGGAAASAAASIVGRGHRRQRSRGLNNKSFSCRARASKCNMWVVVKIMAPFWVPYIIGAV